MRSALLVAFIAVSCGPGMRQKSELRAASTDAFIDAVTRGDAAAIEGHLDDTVVYAGLHFPDPECIRQFPTPAKIDAKRRAQFAACLATLKLRSTARVDTLWGVSVLEYEPGIEIEVVFRFRKGRGLAAWIGYSGRRDIRDGLPTITPSALEAHRLSGDPIAVPSREDAAAIEAESAAAEVNYAYAWMKVCLDASGAVTGVHSREVTSTRAEAAFAAAIRKWTFRPFLLGRQATPVCAMLRLAHPAAIAQKDPEVLPLPFPPTPGAIRVPIKRMKRIEGVTMIVPDNDDKVRVQRASVERVISAYRFCIDETGNVMGVAVVEPSGLPAYDAKIQAGILTWRHKPYVLAGVPVKACAAVTFIYTQR